MPASAEASSLLSAIDGHTRVVFMIGHPVTQVKLPGVFNPRIAAAVPAGKSMPAVIVPVDVPPSHLPDFLAAFRGMGNAAGLVGTIPHKVALAQMADSASPRVQRLGVANVLRRDPDGSLHAEMTDGIGFVAAARHHRARIAGGRALLVGAGGAGHAIALSLAEAGLAHLSVIDPDRERVHALTAMLAEAAPALTVDHAVPDPATLDLAINASPIGMAGHPGLPLALPYCAPHTLFADAVGDPLITEWLAAAQAAGAPIQTGKDMAAFQIPAIAEFLGIAIA